jgi:hypothetical protein
MLAALVSSLALLATAPTLVLAQNDPQPAPEAQPAAPAQPSLDTAVDQATSQPPTEAPADAPVAAGDNPATQAQADALAKGEDPFPAGAPTDDYGLVGWCYGALAGHMDLYKRAMPEVERIERACPDPAVPVDEALKTYADQHSEGEAELKKFEAALDAADKAQPGSHDAARKAAIGLGHGAWKGAENADKRTLAQLWMSWELPARCEPTTQRLLTASGN